MHGPLLLDVVGAFHSAASRERRREITSRLINDSPLLSKGLRMIQVPGRGMNLGPFTARRRGRLHGYRVLFETALYRSNREIISLSLSLSRRAPYPLFHAPLERAPTGLESLILQQRVALFEKTRRRDET